jgi:quinoprotein glucose dehydrogenase
MIYIYRSIAIAVLILAAVFALRLQSEPGGGRSFATWSQYLGGADSSQYSSLTQIDKTTVSRLQIAWRYPSGDSRSYRFNPTVVDGTMYVLAKDNSIVALDARTGEERWAHANTGAVGDRGVNYWENADRSDRRLLYLNAGFLTAIDARTGAAIPSFGDNGRVDLRAGLNRDLARIRPAQTHNPGRIYENLIILALPAGGAGYVASPAHARLENIVGHSR